MGSECSYLVMPEKAWLMYPLDLYVHLSQISGTGLLRSHYQSPSLSQASWPSTFEVPARQGKHNLQAGPLHQPSWVKATSSSWRRTDICMAGRAAPHPDPGADVLQKLPITLGYSKLSENPSHSIDWQREEELPKILNIHNRHGVHVNYWLARGCFQVGISLGENCQLRTGSSPVLATTDSLEAGTPFVAPASSIDQASEVLG